jgi:RNA polymerase sigma-70 factor, ECF subfamily
MHTPKTAINAWLDRCDQRAAQWLYTTYRPLVHRSVAGWLPNAEMINDVVQETFIKAFKAMHRLEPLSNFEPWLCTIARNTSANHLRNWQRNIVRPATDCGIEDLHDVLTTTDAPLNEDEQTDLAIEQLLSRLGDRDRALLTLIYYEGRSARDVGKRLGLSECNVRMRLMRSHRALRKPATQLRAAGRL